MDQELLKFAISQGLFAALFVWLLIDTRKESKNREESLNKTIEENSSNNFIVSFCMGKTIGEGNTLSFSSFINGTSYDIEFITPDDKHYQ